MKIFFLSLPLLLVRAAFILILCNFRNILLTTVYLEIRILGIILLFFINLYRFGNLHFFSYLMLLLAVSARETRIGLSLFVKVFLSQRTLKFSTFSRFKY